MMPAKGIRRFLWRIKARIVRHSLGLIAKKEAKKQDRRLDQLLLERGHHDLRVTVVPVPRPDKPKVALLLYLKDPLNQVLMARADYAKRFGELVNAAVSGESEMTLPFEPPLRLEIIAVEKRRRTEQYLVIPYGPPTMRPAEP